MVEVLGIAAGNVEWEVVGVAIETEVLVTAGVVVLMVVAIAGAVLEFDDATTPILGERAGEVEELLEGVIEL